MGPYKSEVGRATFGTLILRCFGPSTSSQAPDFREGGALALSSSSRSRGGAVPFVPARLAESALLLVRISIITTTTTTTTTTISIIIIIIIINYVINILIS